MPSIKGSIKGNGIGVIAVEHPVQNFLAIGHGVEGADQGGILRYRSTILGVRRL